MKDSESENELIIFHLGASIFAAEAVCDAGSNDHFYPQKKNRTDLSTTYKKEDCGRWLAGCRVGTMKRLYVVKCGVGIRLTDLGTELVR